MKLTPLLNDPRLSVSFEVFPPKTDAAFESVESAVHEIARLKPTFMSVTYGAGGGTSRYTLEIAQRIKRDHGVPTLAHLTCVSSTRESVRERIAELKEAGIENVMALRGDIPADRLNEDRSGWDYRYAVDLIRELKESGADFCIGGACYPECHPECGHIVDDIANIKRKVDAGVDFLTTQMFFDNNVYFHYLSRLRSAGVTVPVIAGIMPVTNGRQIARICALSGTYLPPRFRSIVDRFGDDPGQMLDAGIAYATEQIVDLFANGVNAVHVYTMNKPVVAERITANLGSMIGR